MKETRSRKKMTLHTTSGYKDKCPFFHVSQTAFQKKVAKSSYSLSTQIHKINFGTGREV